MSSLEQNIQHIYIQHNYIQVPNRIYIFPNRENNARDSHTLNPTMHKNTANKSGVEHNSSHYCVLFWSIDVVEMH